MFLEPNRTPYDLAFRLFGFRVRVHPLFWLGTAIFGGNLLQPPGGIEYLLVWIVVVLVSILVHELGHAAASGMGVSDRQAERASAIAGTSSSRASQPRTPGTSSTSRPSA